MIPVYYNTEKIGETWTIKAVSAAVSGQRFVTPAGAAASSGGNALGISLIDIQAGEDLSVALTGVVKIVAGNTVAINDAIQADTNAKAITLIAGGYNLGLALTSGAVGESILVKL